MTRPTSQSIVDNMEWTNTQEKILKAARGLFLAKGYPTTTVDEIVEKAGVSKGSFYHAFPSKEEMGLVLLEWYQLGGEARFLDGPFAQIKDPRKRMFAYIDHIEEISKDMWGHGCLFGNLGLELAETSPKIRKKISQLFDKIIRRLEPIFEPAGVNKGTKGHPSAKELAEQFLVIMEGTILLARVYKDWKYFTRGMQNFRNYLTHLTH